MAISIRGLCKLNIGLANNIFRKTNFVNVGVRFIYAEKSIGVTAYENTRLLFRNQFMSIEDTFRSKMQEACDKEDGVIFTEDLKAMLHLAQKNEDDMKLVLRMIEKYLLTSKDLKFGSFTFGPVVMRMFYYLKEPQRAFSAISNPAFNDFFNQRSSYQIVMCLLYQFEMYNEMRQVFNSLLQSDTQKRHGMSCLTVVLAGCYKQNTPEVFNYALDSWKSLTSNGTVSSGRATALLASMALKQNAPEIALEVLSTLQKQYFINVRCLKLLAYMKLHNYIHIIPLIKKTLERDMDGNVKHTYFADVIYALEDQLRNENCDGDLSELFKLISELKRQERLTTHITLEENLLKPVVFNTLSEQNRHVGKRNVRSDSSRVGLQSFL